MPTKPPVLDRRRPLWQRLFLLAFLGGGGLLLTLVALVITAVILFQRPGFQEWFFLQTVSREVGPPPPPPAGPRVPYPGPEPSAAQVTNSAGLFVPTNLWSVHLRFSTSQWDAVQPRRIPPLRGWLQADGSPLLRNPRAARAGLAGVLGFDQPWSQADLTFADVALTNVAIRFKGNGTFMGALGSAARPFKIDLDRHVAGRLFAGQSELNLHNLVADASLLRDTLAYEYFRGAGVPAPRTAYARVSLTVDGRWEQGFLGLYLLVENPDGHWLADALGTAGGAVFKPVTLELFHDLGDDWNLYEPVYDPKTPVSEAQRLRLRELARLVTHADDAEFARRADEFLDLPATARFLATEALLSNYDSLFDNGQNFILWLDPRTQRFGFSPWDLDHSWGEFPFAGTPDQRVRADLWHPWIGTNRFLERLYGVDAFRTLYREELTRQLDSLFVPDRLHRRIDELAGAIRPAVAGEPEERLQQFELAVQGRPETRSSDKAAAHARRRPAHDLKDFISRRAAEARAQLEGRSAGVIIRRGR